MQQFDVVIIGSGTAGQSSAYNLAAEGYSIALVEESDKPGGVCALKGCQAKKWFYEAAETVARSRHLQDLGVIRPPEISWQQILREKNRFTSQIPENTVNSLRGNGITYIEGAAKFIDTYTLQVGEETVKGRYFIIATGAKPRDLPFSGSSFVATSDDFLDLENLPARIAFIGGGFISFEFAHFAARLGCKKDDVHILEVNSRPLRPFDSDMVNQLVEASGAEGINLHTDIVISAITQLGSSFQIELESGKTLEVDLVVNGAGRTPNIELLDLDKAGVDYNKSGIEVDRSMMTSQTHIFAVGDCAASLMLARVGDREAQIAADAIVATEEGGELPQIDYSAAPAVLFTYPQLGMVGKTEESLKKEGIKYWKSYDSNLGWPTYRRLGMKHAAYKILVDENDHIIGAHFLSDNATGMLNTFKQAMIDKTPIGKLRDDNVMAPYPSRESDILYMLNPLLE
jgi:glutathione reductase (NADPH)